MDGKRGRRLSARAEGAEIGDEHGVRPEALQCAEVSGKLCKVRVAGEDVDGDIHLFAARMGKSDALRKLFVGKIIGKGAQGKALAAHIDGVRPVVECKF